MLPRIACSGVRALLHELPSGQRRFAAGSTRNQTLWQRRSVVPLKRPLPMAPRCGSSVIVFFSVTRPLGFDQSCQQRKSSRHTIGASLPATWRSVIPLRTPRFRTASTRPTKPSAVSASFLDTAIRKSKTVHGKKVGR